MFLPSTGVLRYSASSGGGGEPYKLIVEVDPQIAEYARALIPKTMPARMPRYPPHISVVRKEIPPNLDLWGKHHDERVDFEYDPEVRFDEMYYWLRVRAPALVALRVELGLPTHRIDVTCPPDGEQAFHITVANRKG